MNLLIWKDNQQHGPFTEEEMRELLAAGTFSRDDLAWTEGQGDWKPLAEVLGRGATPPPPPDQVKMGATEASHSRAQSMAASVKGLAESVAAKTVVAGHLAQKQALRKKLELVDLKHSDYLLGVKAYEGGAALPGADELSARLDELKEQIAVLQLPQSPQESFTDKAKAAGSVAVNRARVEKLKMEQRFAFTALGTKWRTSRNPTPALLRAEMNATRAIEDTIQGLDAEIERMSRGTYPWARQPLLVLVMVLLVLAGAALGVKALTKNHGRTAAAAPRVVDFKGYNKAGWIEGFYKGEIGPLNANRQEILFYCNFFDQTITDLAPLLHDVEIQQLIASQIIRHQLPDQMAGFRALVDFVKQAQAPNGPQQMMDNAMSQETLKAQAKQDAERLVATGDAETVRRVYNGLRTFVRDEGNTR